MKEFDKAGCKKQAEDINKAIDVLKDETLEPIRSIRKFALIALGDMKGYEEYHSDSCFDETRDELEHCSYAIGVLTEDYQNNLSKTIDKTVEWMWEEYDG